MTQPVFNVCLGLPSGDGWYHERHCVAVEGATSPDPSRALDQQPRFRLRRLRMTCSLLPYTFNHLWCHAMNPIKWGDGAFGSADFFAMLHSDVAADPGWVRSLIELCIENDADAVSAVCALKGPDGLTSCGVDPHGPLQPHRRATMHELAEMPLTWSAADMGYENCPTLINTGCWVWDLRRPLAQQFTGFHFFDQVGKFTDAEGREHWRPSVEPEDWRFSQWAFENGGKVLNTRAVKTWHFGGRFHTNDPESPEWASGTMERDEPYYALIGAAGEKPVVAAA